MGGRNRDWVRHSDMPYIVEEFELRIGRTRDPDYFLNRDQPMSVTDRTAKMIAFQVTS